MASTTGRAAGLRGRTWRRVLAWLALLSMVAVAVAFLFVELRSRRRFDAPYPPIAASEAPEAVARGEYLVYAAAACASCHVPREEWPRLAAGERLPLTGDHLFRLPFGDIYSANLTPDPRTGIGRRSDGELARILRYGVRADGRAAFPLMEFDLSDEDLVAVVSYLRSRPPVAHDVQDHEWTLLGKALLAFAIAPVAPAERPLARSPVGATVERGAYLAHRVSSCVSCHTDRGEDGRLIGAPFGGGQRMDVAADPTTVFVAPNLTPDPATSPVGRWSETEFVARFRAGEILAGTPMPWGAFAQMTDEDLSALYRYLRTLPPTAHDTGPPVQPKHGGGGS